jgi:hypothetical protein
VPLLLYDQNAWYCLLPNYLLGVYTTGCLDVAENMSRPYVDLHGSNEAVVYFQTQIHMLLNSIRSSSTKSIGKDIAFLLEDIDRLKLPNPIAVTPCHASKSWA